ncbi:hypothetical protein MLD38_032233 [Melastoma candidum]|uniref:Uncharacterized protein n=1 Tax=Melastoma candidum TaxID=119954 RepID=A0ACB9M3M4_9MYRT|nr:hypothetical protein MLD38_032233 [Melastoma candidum]
MALKLPAKEAAQVAIASIGRGYDVAIDLRLKYCKGDSDGSRLIKIDDADSGQDLVLPGGISIPNVSRSIKCDKGERTRFRSDVLSFQQMSEQFNQDLSLTGKIPSGLFNAMFEFQGFWQKDAANTKTLAFDGVFITLYTVALEKSQIVLCNRQKCSPILMGSSCISKNLKVRCNFKNDFCWIELLQSLLLFIETYGTHIVTGVKMGGKDVIYVKQLHSSSLQPANVQKRLKEMADKRFWTIMDRLLFLTRFTDTIRCRTSIMKGSRMFPCLLCRVHFDVDQQPSFMDASSSSSYLTKERVLSHAINLYLRCEYWILRTHQFLEFQLPRQWAPVFSELPLGPQRKRQSTGSLRFSLIGPKLFVNTSPVDVGNRPVTGLRLYLEGNEVTA